MKINLFTLLTLFLGSIVFKPCEWLKYLFKTKCTVFNGSSFEILIQYVYQNASSSLDRPITSGGTDDEPNVVAVNIKLFNNQYAPLVWDEERTKYPVGETKFVTVKGEIQADAGFIQQVPIGDPQQFEIKK